MVSCVIALLCVFGCMCVCVCVCMYVCMFMGEFACLCVYILISRRVVKRTMTIETLVRECVDLEYLVVRMETISNRVKNK